MGSISRRKLFHADRFIKTKFIEHAMEEMDFVFEMAELKKQRPYNLMLIGDSGAGKTSLINEYCRRKPFSKKRRKNGILETEYIAIDMPVGTTEKKLLEELVKAAGGSKHSSNLQESFDKLANNIKLKAVIIDEFHHLLGTQKNNLVICLNQLKRITNVPKLSLIISGNSMINLIAGSEGWCCLTGVKMQNSKNLLLITYPVYR